MATRMYFSPAEPPAFMSANALWQDVSAFTNVAHRGTLSPWPVGRGGYHSHGISKTVVTNPWNGAAFQAVSDPIPVGFSLSGTFKMAILINEATAAADMMLQATITVVSGDASVVRGHAYSGQTATVVSTLNTDPNFELSTAGVYNIRTLSGALTAVTVQAGDRIVVTLGVRSVTAATSLTGTVKLSDREDASGDTPDAPGFATTAFDKFEDAVGESVRSWIEFSQDIFPITLAAETFRLGHVGTLINDSVSGLPFIDLESIEGLDAVEPRLFSVNREGLHGGYVSSEFEGVRTITLSGAIYALPTQLDTFLNKLKQEFSPVRRDRPLFFGADSGITPSYFVLCKPQGIRYGKTRERSIGKVPFQVQFVCQDPRIYRSDALVPTSVSLEMPTAVAVSTNFTVSGIRDVPAKIDVYAKTGTAAIVNPQFTIANQSGLVTLQWSGTLTDADLLTIDLDTRTVIKNMNTSVRTSLAVTSGNWLLLSPGTNRLSLNKGSGGTYVCKISYRSAW